MTTIPVHAHSTTQESRSRLARLWDRLITPAMQSPDTDARTQRLLAGMSMFFVMLSGTLALAYVPLVLTSILPAHFFLLDLLGCITFYVLFRLNYSGRYLAATYLVLAAVPVISTLFFALDTSP